jgi:hypothetical protein
MGLAGVGDTVELGVGEDATAGESDGEAEVALPLALLGVADSKV